MCETNVTSDALNCGACGTACAVGAACADSVCGAPAVQLTTLSQPLNQQGTLEVNANAVFWMNNQNGQSGILSVPIAGGSPTTVTTDPFCQGPQAFAVDDDNLYYVSTNDGTGTGSGGPALVETPLAGGPTTVLVPNSNGEGSCPVLVVDRTNVYALTQVAQGGPSVTELVDVPIAGGATSTLAMSSSYGSSALVLTPTDAIVEVQNNNGPESYAAIPIAGGPAVTVPGSASTPGGSAFTADATNIYAIGSSCPCGGNDNGNNNSSSLPPTGQVVMLPIAGGPPTTLAQFTGQASSIAVDATNVYWSTDSAVWTVPIAPGGKVSSLAGNLTGGVPAYQCNGSCGSSGGVAEPTLIAVDATSVYIADYAAGVDAILKVPK
jgi:hypothetical protein